MSTPYRYTPEASRGLDGATCYWRDILLMPVRAGIERTTCDTTHIPGSKSFTFWETRFEIYENCPSHTLITHFL